MTAIAISVLVFVALVGSAMGVAAVRARAPAMLVSGESSEVIRRVISLIAVLAALMLGMGIASLKSTFDSADRDVRQLGAQIEDLDRTLRHIGPHAAESRQLLFRLTTALVRDTFPELDAPFRGEPGVADDLQDDLEASLEHLGSALSVPRLVIQAQAESHAIVQTRWSMEERTGPTVSGWQLGVLVFWLMLIFAGLGLFAPRNILVAAFLLLCAVALAFAVFLLTEFDNPFTGIIAVSGDPLMNALHALADN